jgi:transaldolase
VQRAARELLRALRTDVDSESLIELWRPLGAAGARPQRPLWPVPAPRTPPTPDVLHVEELIAPDVVNTMPEATLWAFADHGQATGTLSESAAAAEDILRHAHDAGIDLAAITAQLERERVQRFCASYDELIDPIKTKTEGTGMTTERPRTVR